MLQWGGLGLILVCTFTLIGGGRGSETIAGFSLVGYLIGFVLIGVGVPFRLAAAKHHGVMLRFDVGRRALCARFQHPGVYEAMQRAAGNAS